MNETCDISIIVPIYNSDRYLEACIESILSQTFTSFELILINDGSTDNSGNICNRYSRCDDRVIAIHKENGGVSSARNKGIDCASGRYVCFIDADDTVECDFLDQLSRISTEGDYDFITGGFKVILRRDQKELRRACPEFSGNIIEFLQNIQAFVQCTNLQSAWGKLYKLDILRNFNICFNSAYSFGEDTLFVYDYLRHTSTVAAVNSCAYHYIEHDRTTLSNKNIYLKLEMYIYLLNQLKSLLEHYEIKLDDDLFFETELCGAFFICLNDLFRFRISIKERNNYIRFMSDQSGNKLHNALSACKNSSAKYRLVNFLLKNKLILLMNLLFQLNHYKLKLQHKL